MNWVNIVNNVLVWNQFRCERKLGYLVFGISSQVMNLQIIKSDLKLKHNFFFTLQTFLMFYASFIYTCSFVSFFILCFGFGFLLGPNESYFESPKVMFSCYAKLYLFLLHWVFNCVYA
jgi:hypothetical protein